MTGINLLMVNSKWWTTPLNPNHILYIVVKSEHGDVVLTYEVLPGEFWCQQIGENGIIG